MEISVLDFLWKEKLLVAVAFVSGGMLLWPLVRKSTGGPWVDPLQATQLINREDALVLDVREPGEFGAGHVLGAKSLPLARLEALPGDIARRKEKPVIVYCDGGERSTKALSALRKQGFTRIANLSGGLKAWQQAGLPVEK
jgi:rhodanese-related sulfurtransferase